MPWKASGVPVLRTQFAQLVRGSGVPGVRHLVRPFGVRGCGRALTGGLSVCVFGDGRVRRGVLRTGTSLGC